MKIYLKNKPYELEQIKEDKLLLEQQVIYLDELPKIKTITVDYKDGQLLGFNLKRSNEFILFRWFQVFTLRKKLIRGKWIQYNKN